MGAMDWQRDRSRSENLDLENRVLRGWKPQCAQRGAACDSGMVTAEFAVALPAVVLVLTFVVTLMYALVLRHQALHAASVGARIAARGEADAAVRQAIQDSGPTHSSATIVRASGLVTVRVSAHAASALDWALPDISQEVTAAAEQADEPGALP